jgi:hypothetical protein
MQIECLLEPALEITATEFKGWGGRCGGGGGGGKVTFIISIKYNANGLPSEPPVWLRASVLTFLHS